MHRNSKNSKLVLQSIGRLQFYSYGIILATISSFIISTYYFMTGDISGSKIEGVLSLLSLNIFIFLRFTTNTELAGNFVLGYLLIVMATNAFRIPHDPDVIFWLLLFPIFTFMIKGAKKGFFFSIFYILGLLFLTILFCKTITFNTALNFFMVSFCIILATFYYESTRKQAKNLLEKALHEAETQKKLLRTLAIRDELTGLNNRRFFNEIFPRELIRLKKSNDVLGFFILDVDFFKQYNDNYGHQAGDFALQQMSSTLLEQFQQNGDFLFRLGGEEFGGIIHGANNDLIIEKVNMICHSVEQKQIPHHFSSISKVLTVSVGIALCNKEGILTEDHLYKLADEALYRAKSSGRNCVVIA